MWSETITIDGSVTAGSLEIEWSLEGYGDTEAGNKDVSSIYAVITGDPNIGDGNTLTITLDGVYPCIDYWVDFNIHCTGSVPVHFKKGFEFDDVGQFLYDKGILTITNVPDPAIAHGFTVVPGLIEDAQLHFCYAWFGHFNFHLTNDLWDLCAKSVDEGGLGWVQGGGPYTFTIDIMGHQYNEDPTD